MNVPRTSSLQLLLSLTAILFTFPPLAKAQDVHPEVFAPGIVSVEGNNVYRGAFSPDGQSFYFFRRISAEEEDYRIWVTRRGDGRWGPAQRVRLGGEHSDLYPTLSPDGRRMIFSSYRPVPSFPEPQANLWMVERRDEGWSDPVYLESLSDPEAYNSGPAWGANGVLRYKRVTWGEDGARIHLRAVPREDGGGFQPQRVDPDFAWEDWRPGYFVWDATYSPDGSIVALGISRVDESGRRSPTDLWVAFRDGTGWTEPTPIEGVNTPEGWENFAVFSPDGSRLLFVRDFSVYYQIPVTSLAAEPDRPGGQ